MDESLLRTAATINSKRAAHPELKVDEVWIGNKFDSVEFEACPWTTVRYGTFAYDQESKVVKSCRPVFIKRWEFEIAFESLVEEFTRERNLNQNPPP